MDTRDGTIHTFTPEQWDALQDAYRRGIDETAKFMLPMTSVKPTQKQLKYMKVGRNDPCPCGSGLKLKKCHLGKPV